MQGVCNAQLSNGALTWVPEAMCGCQSLRAEFWKFMKDEQTNRLGWREWRWSEKTHKRGIARSTGRRMSSKLMWWLGEEGGGLGEGWERFRRYCRGQLVTQWDNQDKPPWVIPGLLGRQEDDGEVRKSGKCSSFLFSQNWHLYLCICPESNPDACFPHLIPTEQTSQQRRSPSPSAVVRSVFLIQKWNLFYKLVTMLNFWHIKFSKV